MRVYRLTRQPYADLSGAGGLRATGRWHGQVAPIVYSSASRALALLEVLVHLDVPYQALPDDYVFQVVDATTNSIETVTRSDMEPGGRAADPLAFGLAWLQSRRSALLRVPSVLIPQEANILLNPAHSDVASFASEIETSVHLDTRLFRGNSWQSAPNRRRRILKSALAGFL